LPGSPGLRTGNDGGSAMTSRLQDTTVRFGQMQPLWEDGERVFCRAAHDIPGSDRRSFIVVIPAAENPTTVILDRLAHEYSLRDHLDAPWAVRPLDLVHERGRTMLVLDDPGGRPLSRLLGSPMELGSFLRLAESLAATLLGLHERGLIHKDINPANILVDDSTSQVWLTGFGAASRLTRERQAPVPPEVIAGTLAYMAPEQTGRMNRSIDSRSDLYSLGVTFYQMLTGSLPFTAHDPMEWVHCHIARTPMPPRQRLETIPAPLSRLVMKLLAKTAEERYQTAAGVGHDLQRCLAEWESRGRIGEFPLAEHDVVARLLIPEKLYGRSREVAALLSSFNQVVATGMPELVLVSGYSGIGKSSVVHELHKVLVPPRGLFAAGKFDQYKRDIPYATVAQAFQSLVRQILSKREAELQDWRAALREALGPNGLLIVDLIPELELVIGEQPAVPDLSPQDAQRRFQTVLRRFIAVFARPEHPLALFLDDLQWLDAATLDLLEDLLTQRDVGHLLLIGAYRDNEVDAAHPLRRKLDAIRRAGAAVQDIVLAPLTYDDLEQLILDSLHCGTKPASPLVQLVLEKTGGNPFFAIQFLSALADEALLVFDHADARWFCDLGRIHAKRYTDNVVDLMAIKLNRLPAETQGVLRQLACIGAGAEFAVLGTVCATSQEAVHDSLWDAVRSGLVLRSEGSYAFQHDRIQEAAYSLIPEASRAEAHLRIGRLLLTHTPAARRDETIFEIVSQFNRSLPLITSQGEREQLAQLNLVAGKRAKNAAAYASALTHFAVGASLLADDCWTRQYPLTYELELHRAECEYLTGVFATAEDRLAALAQRATNLVDRAAVARQRISLYTVLDRLDRATDVGLEFLGHVGIDWSPHPTRHDVDEEYAQIWQRLGGRSIEQLVDLLSMTDPGWRATVDVLVTLSSPAGFMDSNLNSLVLGRIINLSLEHGHTDGSCFAYVYSNLALGACFGDYRSGFRFAKLGFDLMESRKLLRFRPRVYLGFALSNSWVEHLSASHALLRRTFEAAREAGDVVFMGYALRTLLTNLIASGAPLAETESEAERALEFARKARFGLVFDIVSGQLALIRTLRGRTPVFGSFNDSEFDESGFEQHLQQDRRLAFAAYLYSVRKLQALYHAGDYSSAIEAETKAGRLLAESPSYRLYFDAAEYCFYGALARAANCQSAQADERSQQFEMLRAHHGQLQTWAEDGPENLADRVALVGAEIARLDGRELDAEHLYEDAIRSARRHGFVQNEALANELAARFNAERGFESIAEMYLVKARDGYLRWGADGKVRQLEARYPQLAVAEPRGGTRTTSPDQQLDVAAVVKASQALSSEMLLPRLIERLMTIALQNAGADRGLLILPHQNDYRIEAEARALDERIVLHDVTSASPAVPESIIRYIMRTQECVILDDAARPNLFSEDPYFGLRRQRSILCLPLVRQGALVGLLYLENALASHVFTPDRARLLELLGSQAAISLENTRLYSDLRDREARYREAQNELSHANRIATMGELTASIAHEVNQPIAAGITNAETALRWLSREPPDVERARHVIGRAVSDVRRAADIVGGIRALVKKAPAQKGSLELNEAILEVIELMRVKLSDNGVVLQTELAQGLPLVQGDRVQLQQVTMNLIMNAVEAMSEMRDGRRELLVSTRMEAGDVTVAIRDSGPGFSGGAFDKVFEAFHTTKSTGLGMGLSICRSIVEDHGGRLWASANIPKGAALQFTLPILVG
jgi:predicted ATPase/signal transduction histidine kinase